MKKIILILAPVILFLFFLPKISDAALTALIKQKLPDYIPIEELSAHVENKVLSVQGKLLGKIPANLSFEYKLSKKHIILIPIKASLYNKEVVIDKISDYLNIKQIVLNIK